MGTEIRYMTFLDLENQCVLLGRESFSGPPVIPYPIDKKLISNGAPLTLWYMYKAFSLLLWSVVRVIFQLKLKSTYATKISSLGVLQQY